MKKKILAIMMVLVLGVLAGCGKADNGADTKSSDKTSEKSKSEEAVTIRVGDNMALGTVVPFLAKEKGFYKDAGINVEILEFSDGSALSEAFAAGEVDVALMGIAPTATWYEKGVDLQVIASANGGGHVILVRADSGINSIEDLKGKVIAEPNLGTVTDTLLRDYILPKAKIDPEKDLTIQSGLKPADMAASLYGTKEVDAIITWEPYVSEAQAQYGDDVKILYDTPAIIKEETKSETLYPVNVVSASKDFIDNHSEELQKFVDVYKKTVDYINTDDSANAEIAKVLQMDEKTIKDARVRVDFTYDIDQKGLTTTLTWAKDLGYLGEIPDANGFYNSDFLK